MSAESISKPGTTVNVILSVCLDTAPSLHVTRSPNLRSITDHLNAVDDPATRQWLTDMNNLVEEAEEEHLLTHGTSPASSVFNSKAIVNIRPTYPSSESQVVQEGSPRITSNFKGAFFHFFVSLILTKTRVFVN